jgi:hypothetical protein
MSSPDGSSSTPVSSSPPSKRRWQDYLPLLVVVGVTAAAAAAKMHAFGPGAGFAVWMHDFMGFFLVVFAMLKLFDLPGFADGFQMYDLLGKRIRAYALLYPFIELALGLAYLARWRLDLVYPVTVFVMTLGAVGVILALKRGLNLQCACMGTTLKVPLSTVALVEDVGMAAMALVMWLG